MAEQRKFGEKAKALAKKAGKAASSKARAAADLNGDGKVDAEDARIAAKWSKDKAAAIGKGAADVAKSVLKTELGKDAAAGAAIGAAVAVPVPVVGPLAGAAIGAGVGAYRNIKKKRLPEK
jgi:hypothetical protein